MVEQEGGGTQRACMQVTTFGKKGAMLLKPVENPTGQEPEATLESVMKDLNERLEHMPKPVPGSDPPGCVAADDLPIFPGNVVKLEHPVVLTFDRCCCFTFALRACCTCLRRTRARRAWTTTVLRDSSQCVAAAQIVMTHGSVFICLVSESRI
jgi:hypothetical protein